VYISFYSERLGKQISGVYSISGRMLIVTSADARQKSAPLGGSSPEILARLGAPGTDCAGSPSVKLEHSPTLIRKNQSPEVGKRKPGHVRA
jgi:hypothetical protein